MGTTIRPWIVEIGKGDETGDIDTEVLVFLGTIDDEIRRSLRELARNKPVVINHDHKKEKNIGR